MMRTGSNGRVAGWWREFQIYLIIALFFVMLGFILLWPFMVHTIEAGHAGVIFRRLFGGTVTETVRDEGLQIIPPWDTLTVYDVRIQQIEHQFLVISNDGLEIRVTVSIRCRPK